MDLGYPISRRDLPLGVLTDHLPLARAGHPAVTIMRGSYCSLRRVHRPGDHIGQLTGEGVLGAVHLVCNTLRRFRGGAVQGWSGENSAGSPQQEPLT
jgi:hypothetical protein